MCVLPPVLVSAISSASAVGFSGSRSCGPLPSVWGSVVSAVRPASVVAVGCASGLDCFARVSFPGASVFRASAFGRGRSSFARRSVALVSWVAAFSSPVFLSFPAVSCPAGLAPSAVPGRCFSGLGSGSWASLAFAVGSGVPCFVWLPVGVAVPAGWGFVSLGGGWWFSCQAS
jgi:hypothetical protein